MSEGRLFRDALGVPHLHAEDELDLAFAQGRITAIDRAWQIEVDRWRAEGRLAAFIGTAGLEWDRYAIRTRLEDTARRAYDSLSVEDRAWVDAYVEGINTGLPHGRNASSEFTLLQSLPGEAPPHEPWSPWVPLGMFHVAHTLFSTFPNVLWRSHVLKTLGAKWLSRLEHGWPHSGGSNAWAISGALTHHGAPLMAGDPHRLLELPCVYQQIRLACRDYDVVGLAFPGVPGIQHFGHAGQVAWGVTNAVAHSSQVFREYIIPSKQGVVVSGPDGLECTDAIDRQLTVRGGGSEVVRSIETRRGTIIIDGHTCYSLREAARVQRDLGFSALRPLLRARSAADVFSAMSRWVEPVNRVIPPHSRGC